MMPSTISPSSYLEYVVAFLGVSFVRQTFTGPSSSGNTRSLKDIQC